MSYVLQMSYVPINSPIFLHVDDLEPSKVVSFYCAFEERGINVTLEADKIASCNASINCENSSYVEEVCT